MIETLIIGLVLAAIITQMPHVYNVFIQASKLKNKNAQMIQAGAFCGIVSVAIFVFVWIDKPMLAAGGAAIESIFNIYYYTQDWWQRGYGNIREDKRKGFTKRLWRVRWIYFFVSVLIPAFIYVFSEILNNIIKAG